MSYKYKCWSCKTENIFESDKVDYLKSASILRIIPRFRDQRRQGTVGDSPFITQCRSCSQNNRLSVEGGPEAAVVAGIAASDEEVYYQALGMRAVKDNLDSVASLLRCLMVLTALIVLIILVIIPIVRGPIWSVTISCSLVLSFMFAFAGSLPYYKQNVDLRSPGQVKQFYQEQLSNRISYLLASGFFLAVALACLPLFYIRFFFHPIGHLKKLLGLM